MGVASSHLAPGSPLLLVTFLLLLASSALGDVATLAPVRDNTLYEDASGGLSNGAGSAMFAGRNSQATNSVRRALVAFDVAAAVPPGSFIESVSLTLFNDAANTGDVSIEMHRLLRDWGEGTSVASGGQGGGAPATPGDATWLHTFHPTDSWAASGGDFAASASAAALVAGPGAYTWASATLAADVQAFLDHPETNFGWILIGQESVPSTGKRFATREAADPELRPELAITYTPVPEPGAVLCLSIGILTAHFGTRRAGRRLVH